jgi:hypothetical protein
MEGSKPPSVHGGDSVPGSSMDSRTDIPQTDVFDQPPPQEEVTNRHGDIVQSAMDRVSNAKGKLDGMINNIENTVEGVVNRNTMMLNCNLLLNLKD